MTTGREDAEVRGPRRGAVESGAQQGADYSDENHTLDAREDSWAWRRRLRSDPRSHLAYRCGVGALGGLVTVMGLVMVPAPGPGWVVVFLGLTILASEFEFAQRLLNFARGHVTRWNIWIMAQNRWLRATVAVATVGSVWILFWGWFAWQGVPSFVPEWAAALVRLAPGVE